MMFFQEPRLALLVFLPLPVLGIMAYRYSKASKRNWTLVREASGDLNSILVEDIQGNRLIHSFALKDREKARFDKIGRKLEKKIAPAMYRWSIQGPGASFTSSLASSRSSGWEPIFLRPIPVSRWGSFSPFSSTQTCSTNRSGNWFPSITLFPQARPQVKGFSRFWIRGSHRKPRGTGALPCNRPRHQL